MSGERRLVTAAEMDRMTPAQRAAAVREGVVHDLGELDPEFRQRVETRARQLAAEMAAGG